MLAYLKKFNTINIRLFIFTSPIKFLSSLGFIFCNIFLIKIVDKEQLGNFILCLSLISLLSIFSKAGFNYSALKLMSIIYYKNQKNKFLPYVKQILFVSGLISLVIIFFIIIFEDFIAMNIYKNDQIRGLLFIMILSLPFYTLVQIQKSIIKSFRFPYLAPIGDMGMLLIFIIILTYVSNYVGFNITIYRLAFLFLITNIILFAFFNLLIIIILFKKFKSFEDNRDDIKNNSFNSKSLLDFFIIDFVNYVFVWGSIFICSFFLDGENLTNFSSIYWLAFAPLFICIVLNSIYSPIFAINYNQGNIIKLKKYFNECRRMTIYLCFPIASIFLLFSSYILNLVFNITNTEHIYCFKILIIATLIRIFFGPVQNILNMCRYENYVKKITFIISVFQIISMFVLLNYYGVISIGFSYLVFNLLRYSLLYKKYKSI